MVKIRLSEIRKYRIRAVFGRLVHGLFDEIVMEWKDYIVVGSMEEILIYNDLGLDGVELIDALTEAFSEFEVMEPRFPTDDESLFFYYDDEHWIHVCYSDITEIRVWMEKAYRSVRVNELFRRW